jgi:hypothetical protein
MRLYWPMIWSVDVVWRGRWVLDDGVAMMAALDDQARPGPSQSRRGG